MKVGIFYHCLFHAENGAEPKLLPHACEVICQQMQRAEKFGLIQAADHFVCGINGGPESKEIADLMIPGKAVRVLHGLKSKAENLTLVEIEKFVRANPGWAIFYAHAKGATRNSDSKYDRYIADWRTCLMHHCVDNWRHCVNLLQSYEAVGAHWMKGCGPDRNQNIFAGNFWWARSDYLRTLPSIFQRDRIKVSGIGAEISRHEAEVWIGNGKRLPRVLDLHRSQFPVCRFNPGVFMRTS